MTFKDFYAGLKQIGILLFFEIKHIKTDYVVNGKYEGKPGCVLNALYGFCDYKIYF